MPSPVLEGNSAKLLFIALTATSFRECDFWRKFISLHKNGRAREVQLPPQTPGTLPRGRFALRAGEIDTLVT
jgi:hypothetical protein